MGIAVVCSTSGGVASSTAELLPSGRGCQRPSKIDRMLYRSVIPRAEASKFLGTTSMGSSTSAMAITDNDASRTLRGIPHA